MLRIFIQDNLFSSQVKLLSTWVLLRRALVRLIPPFGHGSHNIRPLDNHLSGLSISLSSLEPS